MINIVYFELNNWCCGKNYPNDKPFIEWIGNLYNIKFRDEEWVKKNKLVVVESVVDMSINYCITTTKDWVLKNCPKLLTDFTQFLRYPEDDTPPEGNWGCPFLEYNNKNIGVHFAVEEENNGEWIYSIKE